MNAKLRFLQPAIQLGNGSSGEETRATALRPNGENNRPLRRPTTHWRANDCVSQFIVVVSVRRGGDCVKGGEGVRVCICMLMCKYVCVCVRLCDFVHACGIVCMCAFLWMCVVIASL